MQLSDFCRAIVFSLSLAGVIGAAEIPPKQIEFFESRIRPVLVEHCYSCHNSAGTSEGDLILDHRAAMLKGGGSGSPFDLRKPAESLLLSVIRHEIEGLEMPDGGPKLDDRIVADFETWIKMGAPDPRETAPSPEEVAAATSWEAKLERRKQWWSFRPIAKYDPPEVSREWSDHPVDRFIMKRLADAGLETSHQAEPSVLVRRLFFNLIGLPPTPDEAVRWTTRLQQSTVDTRDSVVEELVDELLASPHFGERWGRHWMDWIRYAESHGSEGDPRIENAWYYRDYLIRALNSGVPCDRLLREHVAGDLLDNPRINAELGINESAIGTAHWRMVFHGFAPTDALDEKVRFTDDQINAFSKAFLGLTVSCARCHDHKFDAISQADYYALFGILGSCRPSRTVIDTPERQLRNRAELEQVKETVRRQIAADWLNHASSIAKRLQNNEVAIPEKKDELRRSVFWPFAKLKNADEGEFDAALKSVVTEFRNRQKATDTFLNNEVVQSWDLADPKDYAAWFRTGNGLPQRPSTAGEFSISPGGDNALTGIYPGGVYSHAVSAKLAARLTSPDFTLPEDCELFVESIGDQESTVRYVVQNYPRNGTVFPVTGLKNSWRWQRYDVTYWSGDQAHVELTSAKDAPLLTKGSERSWFGVRRVVLQKKNAADPGENMDVVAPIVEELQRRTPASYRDACDIFGGAIIEAVKSWQGGSTSNRQAALLDACLRNGLLPNTIDNLPSARESIEEYRRLENEVVVPTRVPGVQETVARNQPLFHRGNHKQPQEEIPRRFLEAIDPTPYQTKLSGRELLAEDLIRDDNPLTRRVFVNRVWHHLFGRGIVGTPGNFGRLGEKPTHPELLDWLANRFVEDGWSLKKLIRSIVLTKTWQLSSRCTAAAAEKDPGNELLSHSNVRRLEAEAIRDSLLIVSGGLDRTVHGPPAQSGSPRRSVYVNVIRNSLDPFLRAFDFPEPFSSVGRRDATNVPAQSLALMNDPQVRRYARQWASAVLRDKSALPQTRIRSMFLAAFGRAASGDDVAMIEQFLDDSQSDLEQRHNEVVTLRGQLAEREQEIRNILTPVRDRLLAKKKQDADDGVAALPEPFAHWAFDGTEDSVGNLNLSLQKGARLSDGALVVNGSGFAISQPIGKEITEKTLHVHVQLNDLNQRGGGAITIMTPNGVYFDSVVFAEQQSQHWLAGSNGFSRTQRFNGTEEQTAVRDPVAISIVYRADGTIIGYRNGQAYGKPYKSSGPYKYQADAVIGFGVRHLPDGGNRMLKARILDAMVFDRALSEDEVAAVASGNGNYVSQQAIVAALTAEQKALLDELKSDAAEIDSKIKAFGEVPETVSDVELWTELAQAMFTFKEFIYVR